LGGDHAKQLVRAGDRAADLSNNLRNLVSLFGTTYGSGDGSTTFNLPDKTGRVSTMQEAPATRLTSSYFGGNSTVPGAVGGGGSQTLTLAQLPTGITSSGSNSISVTSTVDGIPYGAFINSTSSAGNTLPQTSSIGQIASTGINSIGVTSTNTSESAHRTVQPTIVCNYIIRIL
jgi:microcystin-dependent protein